MNSTAVKAPVSTADLMNDVHAIENVPMISDLLNVICRVTGMRFAAVARVTEDKWMACSVHDEIEFGLKPGGELKLETTICNEIRQSHLPIVIDHVSEDKDFCNHPTPAMYGFQSYISVPIFRNNGSFFGTLCAIDPAPNKLKTEAVTAMFSTFSGIISHHINSSEEVRSSKNSLLSERELHKKIEESEEHLNVIIDASGLGTWSVDLITKEMIGSEKFYAIMGHPADAKLTLEDTTRQLHSSDMQSREKAMNEAMETGILSFSGRVIWPDQTIHWVERRGKILYDENKRPVKMIGTMRDVTDEKEFAAMLEKKVRERTAQVNNKNEELEKINNELQAFAYVSSHDLQEPLRKIQTFAALVEQEGGLSEKVQDYFNRMQKAAQRMQALIVDLLAYSRTGTAEKEFEKMDLNLIISQVKDNLKEELQQKNATVETKGLCELNIIPFQMRQLFQNLISNSIKFAAPDRSPHISIESTIGDAEQFGNKKLHEGQYCLITITDNGIGFEKEYNEKVFELFQRLHGRAAYNGTGIGLSIVKKIAENHGGIITAEGKLGEGTVFSLFVPVIEH